MLELKLTDEERELRNSYCRKQRAKQLHLVTSEERSAVNKYRNNKHQLNPLLYCISSWRGSAKARGIEWSLSEYYLLALMSNTTVCPILGVTLVYERYNGTGKHNPARASLDRIDNTKAYTEDNVRIVSWAFNLLKGTLTDAQVLSYARCIVKNLGDSNNVIL